jgi:chaperone required for assembly of F1-ATPase
MRNIFTEIFENQPLDPMQSARKGGRPSLRKRSYERAHIGEGSRDGFPVLLDGKPVKTPARRALIAQEWNAQQQAIDPARMPLTRLANAVIDAVAEQAQAVADEVANYLGSDLLCYRADAPEGLVTRQTQSWDPVLAWAQQSLGARFVLIQGVVFAEQPRETIAAARAAIPAEPWALGAVASITQLTGSALLALALSAGAFDAAEIWAAAHVDEDWQMEYWGRDELALERRANRFADFNAAVAVLASLR